MSYSRTWGQGFTTPGTASMNADPDIDAQGLQQRLLQGAQTDADMRKLQAQIAAQQQQQAAQNAWQGSENSNQRTFQGQMLTQQGANERELSAQQARQQAAAADANFGYTTKLTDQQFGNTRTLNADQFGYTQKLAEQNNAFQQALLGQSQTGQRQLSAQEAQQQLQRDSAQFGYTSKLNEGSYANQQTLQHNDLASRMDLAKLQDSGETGRLGMSLGQARYATDQQTALGRDQIAAQERIAQGPLDLARQKFAATMPLLQTAISSGSAGGGGYFDPGGVQGQTKAPTSVYDQGQIDQQVNAQMASNARRMGGDATAARQSAAARGIGTNSGALLSQLQGLDVARMGEDATAAREIPFQAAKANADQATAAAGLQEQDRATTLNAMVNQRQIAANQRNALISALAGIV